MSDAQTLAANARKAIGHFREYLNSIEDCLGKIEAGEGERYARTVDDECHRLKFLAAAIADLADQTRAKLQAGQ